jgi:AhpD family alkylhydroperoxidase
MRRLAGITLGLSLNPAAGRALIELHEAALRNPSGLVPGDKELIAAYVSGLNACQYCYGVHSETARAFGHEGYAPLLRALPPLTR